jgi:ribosome-associated toxin RatA of RatAB toxin-antitoxin module/CRP-like cAMP-binding protein
LDLRRTVLVPYAVESMFDLIEQAEHYPQFLPWCVSAKILERSDEWVAARIDFKYLHVRFGFQTRNPKRRPEWLQVRLVEGPFKRFQADWRLTPLGTQGCRISFDLSYEVSDGLLDRVAVRAVEMVSRSMMDAFVKRAEATLQPAASLPPTTPVAAPDTVPVPMPVPMPVPFPASDAAPPLTTPPAAPPSPPKPTPTPTPTDDVATRAAGPAPNPSTPREPTMTTVDPVLLEAVRACPLSAELNPQQAATLASLMELHTFAPRQVLAPEGSTDNRLYVVVDGSLSVVKGVGTPDEALLITLNPGDFAHELGFLDGAARYASLLAASQAHVLSLEREKLESLITTDPLVLYRVMCAIVRTVHRIQTRLSMQASELTNYIVKQHGRY